LEQVLVIEVGDGNDVDAGVYGHLYGVTSDVPRGSDDHDRLSAHRLCILEQHLPGGYRDDGGGCCFYVIQRLWFAGNHPGRGHGELGLGATELRISDAIDFVGRREPVTPGPTFSTRPDKSEPSVSGGCGLTLLLPSRMIASQGATPAAITRTRISLGPGDGIGTSSTTTTSGAPKL
jgi:hypothetical protein